MWDKDTLFSSKKQDWSTPRALFDTLNEEFNFTLDAAASPDNYLVSNYITEEVDSLNEDWEQWGGGGAVWLNPPYGRAIPKWIEKAYLESKKGICVVCLVFCRSDTRWWHQWAMRSAEIRLIPGRISFGGSKAGAPAPSCLLIFDEERKTPQFRTQTLPRR